MKDTAYYYFLNVSDYRGVGEEKPYEFARSEVKDLLVNQETGELYGTGKERLVSAGGK